MKTKPFLKWAGGKSRLLPALVSSLPPELNDTEFTYVEPFVGSGAMLFWMLDHYKDRLKHVVINDLNADLINAYMAVAANPDQLLSYLYCWDVEYSALTSKQAIEDYYYKKRELFNSRSCDAVEQAALFLFLNRTCFNGLYRVNREQQFNVACGFYKRPLIYNKDAIIAACRALQRVNVMLCGDFTHTLQHITTPAFVYLDPPYLNSFAEYSYPKFDHSSHVRLRQFCRELDSLGCWWMMSNYAVGRRYFEKLYSRYHIQTLQAPRSISADGHKRKPVTEFLVTNYQVPPQLPPGGKTVEDHYHQGKVNKPKPKLG